jgi:hypothetical protein
VQVSRVSTNNIEIGWYVRPCVVDFSFYPLHLLKFNPQSLHNNQEFNTLRFSPSTHPHPGSRLGVALQGSRAGKESRRRWSCAAPGQQGVWKNRPSSPSSSLKAWTLPSPSPRSRVAQPAVPVLFYNLVRTWIAGVGADGVVPGCWDMSSCRESMGGGRQGRKSKEGPWKADALGKGTAVLRIDEGGHGGGCAGCLQYTCLLDIDDAGAGSGVFVCLYINIKRW